VLESLVGVVEKTEFGAKLVFEVNVPEDLRLPVAGEDLLEIAGALIENAARYARRRVRITGEPTGAGCLIVEDDGPGIDSEKVAAALARGGRLDEAGPGHGLGLAIANDLVDATRGQLTLVRSELGGLKVTVAWITER
jgi:signal transduction histidine kinase